MSQTIEILGTIAQQKSGYFSLMKYFGLNVIDTSWISEKNSSTWPSFCDKITPGIQIVYLILEDAND